MKYTIKQLSLNNFRLYDNKIVDFEDGINILVGKNASGKTTILEAINLFGVGRSFRTYFDTDIVKKNKEFYFIKGLFENDNNKEEIVLSYTQKGKKIIVNGNSESKISDYIGKVKTVCFSPLDLNIVKGEPKQKRNFIDQTISILDKEYLKDVILYNRLLKERNEVLKKWTGSIENEQIIKVYSIKMVEVAKKIIIKRKKYIEKIGYYANVNIQNISNHSEMIKIVYKENINEEDIEYKYLNCYKEDVSSQTTLFGPHRDSYVVLINNDNINDFGSNGQQKSAAIAMKLAVSDLIKEKEQNAIILLDDVFGELDGGRQKYLIKNLKEKGQVIISTTDISLISEEIINDSKIIKMDEGE